jgi:hypothetical protein
MDLRRSKEYFSQKSYNTFFSAVHGTFSKRDILGHKASLNKHKNIEVTSCILSDQRVIKLEISNKRNYKTYSNRH